MLIFLIFTVIFLIANIGMGKFMWVAIQPMQLFDRLFGYRKFLDWLYGKGSIGQALEMLFGGCDKCFLHLISIINFAFYVVFMTIGLDQWIIGNNILVNIVWYFVYVSIAWFSSYKINADEPKKDV